MVVIGAASAIIYLSGRRSAGVPDLETTERRVFVDLGNGAALAAVSVSIKGWRAERVDRRGPSLAKGWTWSGPAGMSSHPWVWDQRGTIAAAGLHQITGGSAAQVEVFDVGRGHIATLGPAMSGSFVVTDDGRTVTASSDTVRVARADGSVVATPITPAENAAFVGATRAHVVVWNGNVSVVGADGAGPSRPVPNVGDIVGLSVARDELLVTRGGRIVVVSLATGADRITLDVANGADVTDGLDNPCMLGAHAGRWLVIYAIGLDHTNAINGRNWTIPAERFLASIDPDSGAVGWRVPLGRWLHHCGQPFRHAIQTDEELPAEHLLYGERDVEGGNGNLGQLQALSLPTGTVRWSAEHTGVTHSNALFVRRGNATYVKILDAADMLHWAIVRFESGRFTGATWMPRMQEVFAPAIGQDGLWVDTTDWLHLRAPDLQVDSGPGSREGIVSARDWAITRLALPAAAR